MFKSLTGRVITGSTLALGLVLCSEARAYCQVVPVADVEDPTWQAYWTNETGNSYATDLQTAQTVTEDTLTAYQTLQEIQTYTKMFTHPQNLQQFTNAVVTINNQNPTAAGSTVANLLVCSQTSNGGPTCTAADQGLQNLGLGGISSIPVSGFADLLNAQGESLGAVGALQALQGLMDGSVAQTSATTQQTDLEAANIMSQAADVTYAKYLLPAINDTAVGSICTGYNTANGGFCVPGLKDYSSANYF